MNIRITTQALDVMRYPTLGDWFWDTKGETLYIEIARGFSPKAFQCMVIHELSEALMCYCDGVTAAAVDAFDIQFEKLPGPVEEEPGDHPACPYGVQHRRAENLERIFADNLNMSWQAYQQEFETMCKALDELKAKGVWGEKFKAVDLPGNDLYLDQSSNPDAHQIGRPDGPPF